MSRSVVLGLTLVALVSAHFNSSECGFKKQCIFVPHGCQDTNNCRQMFSYAPRENGWTEMEMHSTLDSPNNNYLAIGFSSDDLMGDDPVTHCAFPDGAAPEAHVTYNFGKSNAAPTETEDLDLEKVDLELVHAHKDEKGMYCQIRQKSGDGKHSYFPDLNKEHQLFVVRGKTRQARSLGIHSLDPSSPDFPFISDRKVAVGKPLPEIAATTTVASATEQTFLSKSARFWLIKIHGVLMIIAWMVCVALAILSARYLRDHFPSSSPGGLKWWFHIHRTLNALAVPLVILATLLVFIAKDWSWTGPVASMNSEYNTNPGAIHSLLGSIAVLIALVQPIMSLMRCAPDTGARPIFNWSHRVLGFIGLTLALISIFIAANSFVSLWSDPSWGLAVVIFYIVILVIAFVLFEVLTHLKTKDTSKVASTYEMRHRGARYDDNGRVITATKIINSKPLHGITFLYIIMALFAVAVAALLIVLIVV
ncbi:unnamed protein product [Caenorhabditis auriculariae]|uniref:Cytochrome b561 domain-containing protein n=1 Tax=Caenorhabditis auriculariae TaxID=2777116 RepID=A0A8S1GZJ4_9PELO|nr:unnamed protein product [Caenorhabditis auriculariae]